MHSHSCHKAGFVNIIGKPNVGKSTLMNRLIGERLSIITSKAQTTRHRIMGIISGENFQIVYSDTPGIINPRYELHRAMMNFVYQALEDADIILWLTSASESLRNNHIIEKLTHINTPIILIINKIDLSNSDEVKNHIDECLKCVPVRTVISISALYGFNVENLIKILLDLLPEHPPFFDKNDLTNKSQRFFASEIIREKIFLYLNKEIPYACETEIQTFKEEKNIIKTSVDIIVERESQKIILIGKGGNMLKKIGTQARKSMEKFFLKKVFLEQRVKVISNWRKKKTQIKKFGYLF